MEQILLLLGIGVAVILLFQRLSIPTALGYLLVGVILGPHTIGPILYVPQFGAIAEFGVVFLLFTIGLNFSLPQLNALRHQVLWPGIGQVSLTAAVVGMVTWLAGLPAAAAFVIGAVFAQSSTTIIGRQLSEQGEENTHHGRFGLAMSVFQDVTAVPFLVIIPVLGLAVGAAAIAGALGWALTKAVFAFALLFAAGKWLLRPLFHFVAERRSAELFTLTVLLVALLAAWTTNSLGLSLAFGGFLAGMMLGETEFRHQVESSIRPFRDVLLGLFFVGIGMRVEPAAIPPIWHLALLGALLILVSKTLIVAALVRARRIDARTAWRTGLLLAVGGEFGFALVAIALDADVIDSRLGQIAITSVLLSMVAGSIIIHFNATIARWLSREHSDPSAEHSPIALQTESRQVVIGGYGRVGHTVAVLLHAQGIPFVVFDTNPARVTQGRADGYNVMYGDIADPSLLTSIHIERAALMVIAMPNADRAIPAISYMRKHCPYVPIVARAWDLQASGRLLAAGATHAYPEAVEASLRLAAIALEVLNVPRDDIGGLLQDVRNWDYRPVRDEPEK